MTDPQRNAASLVLAIVLVVLTLLMLVRVPARPQSCRWRYDCTNITP